MKDLNPQEHAARFTELETQAANFRNLWQEIQEYVTPWRDPITSSRGIGQKQTDRIFDSTAPTSLTISAAAVHSLTAPAGVRWFNLSHPDPEVAMLVEVGQALETATNAVRSSIHNSNFSQESQEVVLDLLAYGTGAIYWEMKNPTGTNPWPGIRFRALSPGSYVISEDAEGIVDTLYRKFSLSAGAIYRRWPETCGDVVKKLCAEGKLDHKMLVIHGVFPRHENVDMSNTMSVMPKNRPFGSIWLVTEGMGEEHRTGNAAGLTPGIDAKGSQVLREDGFFDFPFLVPRWYKMSGESYGRSPIMNVLPTIRTLNKAVELRLKAWQLAIAPPMVTSDRGIIGDVRLNPFGRTHSKGDPRTAIMALNIGSDFNVANFQEEILKNEIKSALFIDQIASAQSQGLTPKSATEVSINFEMMMRILGPVSTRLQGEFLVPIVTGIYRALVRHEILSTDMMSELGEGGTSVIFEGPLARSTSIQEIDAISRWLQVALPLAEMKPEVLRYVDFEALGKVAADAVGIPRSIMKTDDAIQAEKEQEAQAQAMQGMMGMGTQVADIMNKVQPAVTQGAAPGGL